MSDLMGQERPLSSQFSDENIALHEFAACAIAMPTLYLKGG